MRNPSLRHVYASLAEFNDTLVAGGAVTLTNASNNARKLEMLDEVSRLIDARCHRGSGFGPWVGTKLYDGQAVTVPGPFVTGPLVGAAGMGLWLRADIDSLTSLTIRPSTGADPVTPTVETDFYLAGLGESYEKPYRRIILHGQGTVTSFGTGFRTIAATGTWSYPYRVRVLTPTTAEALDETQTDFDVSVLDGLSAGQTILVDDEQMYVSATTPAEQDSITVERGVNGTTATTHETSKAISRFIYDPSVNNCALRLAERRLKSRDAGADGVDGGALGATIPEGEDKIINRMLGQTVMLVGMV